MLNRTSAAVIPFVVVVTVGVRGLFSPNIETPPH